MTYDNWLKQSELSLKSSGITTPRLDALLLLEHVTKNSRSKILAEPTTIISPTYLKKLNNLLNRRLRREPLAYIFGHVEFYSHNFVVNKHVLVPRPESENMIDELKTVINKFTHPTIVDVGTGSGALGICAKIEAPKSRVFLLDIDSNALKVAITNVDLFTLPITTVKSDLLSNLSEDPDILLCNLPYIPDDYEINIDARHEPKLAIFAGPDGLDLYRKLFHQLDKRQNRPLYLLCESLPHQHDALASIASQSNYKLLKTNDFIQIYKRINL